MHSKVGVIILCLVAVLMAWGFSATSVLILVQYKGSEIRATVVKVDVDCDRYNKIEVRHVGKFYTVSISRTDCNSRVYKVGEKVSLLKYKNYDTLVWPDAQYQWLPFAYLILLALVFYTYKDKFRK